jgi:hypothetical protein
MTRFMFMAALLLAGCVGPAPAPMSSACGWDKIIHPAETDTIETLRQVDEHNKSLRASCPELAAL